jgi:hypothetical protein
MTNDEVIAFRFFVIGNLGFVIGGAFVINYFRKLIWHNELCCC